MVLPFPIPDLLPDKRPVHRVGLLGKAIGDDFVIFRQGSYRLLRVLRLRLRVATHIENRGAVHTDSHRSTVVCALERHDAQVAREEAALDCCHAVRHLRRGIRVARERAEAVPLAPAVRAPNFSQVDLERLALALPAVPRARRVVDADDGALLDAPARAAQLRLDQRRVSRRSRRIRRQSIQQFWAVALDRVDLVEQVMLRCRDVWVWKDDCGNLELVHDLLLAAG
eukprot:5750341-Pleurochrysis_carterae.AAC.2